MGVKAIPSTIVRVCKAACAGKYPLLLRHGAVVKRRTLSLVAIHIMLSEGLSYHELGAEYRRRVDAERYERKLIERVRGLGYDVVRREPNAPAV